MDIGADRILQDLETLRKFDRGLNVFGAELHKYILNPKLSESEIESVEKKYSIVLPEDYRSFLIHVGNGGAGPAYGVFRLGEMGDPEDDNQQKPWDVGEEDASVSILSEPFPHVKPWNDLDGFDIEDIDKRMDFIRYRYFNPGLVNGAIPICHFGCNIYLFLVVTGPEAGHLWYDDRADCGGIYPLEQRGKTRVSFIEWYCNWLDDSLSKVRNSS